MKKLLIMLAMASVLNGCASYADLDAECATGSKIACNEMAERSNMFSIAADAMEQTMEQQAVQERANIEAANQMARDNRTYTCVPSVMNETTYHCQ